MHSVEEFFYLFLQRTTFDLELRALPSKDRLFTRDYRIIEKFMKSHENENCYFGVYTRQGGGKSENVREANCLFADLDFKGYEKGQQEAEGKLKAFKFKPSIIIHSGNGFHAYWWLKDVVKNTYEQEQRIKGILKGISLKILSDPAVADIARILRIPGSYNHKCVPPRKVEILHCGNEIYNLDDFKEFELQDMPMDIKSEYTISMEAIFEKCKFIQYCSENRSTMPEPLWYAMISNIARLVNGPNMCHELSIGYHRYNKRETDQKILHAINASAPMTCRTIKELMRTYVGEDCGMSCDYKSPAAVVSGFGSNDKAQSQIKKEIITKTMFDLMKDTVNFIENRYSNPDKLSGVATGFKEFDEILDGFQPGNLIIMAARPGDGKSALMLNMAQAGSKECPVGIISLEMTPVEKGVRLLAANTNILINQFRKGRLSKEEVERFINEASKLAELPVFFQYGIYTDEIMGEAVEMLTQQLGCRLIFIDHLHLMSASKTQQNKNIELSVLTRTAKRLAQKYNVPIVFLCQLNRAIEKENREPRLSDLRESGAIEQDADVVIFLHPDKEIKDGLPAINAIIAKGRNIGKGRIKLNFMGGITKFVPYIEDI